MRPKARILPMVERIRSIAFRPPLERQAADELATLLDGFVARSDWQALPCVAALAFSTDPLTAEAAAIPVANLLARVPLVELAGIDRALRQGGWFTDFFTSAWWELRPGVLPRGRRQDPTFAPLTRLAMSHPNGHVREAAVRHAAEKPTTDDLPFLLLRADDWVAPVREAAAEALALFLTPRWAAEIVRLLPLYGIVAARKRLHRAVVDGFAAVLGSPAGRAALLADTRSTDPLRRRAAYRSLLDERMGGDRSLLARALADRDIQVRIAALLRIRALGLLAEMGSILRGDPVGTLRAVGLEILPPGSPVHVADYLADRSSRVRHVAQKLLVGRGEDVLARTREVVARTRGRRLASALEALAEVARPADLVIGRSHLGAPSAGVRAAALRVVVGAGDPGAIEVCLAALGDPSPAVARVAAALLRPLRPPLAAVERAIHSIPAAHGKKEALKVLASADYWRQLPVLLRARASPDVTASLVRWIGRRNRVRGVATPDELADARAALARARLEPIARAAIAQILGI